MYKRLFKRLIDIVLSGAALVILSPAYLIITLKLRHSMGSPVIFHQQRGTIGGRPFKLYKFRSMTNETDSSGNLLPDHSRLTTFGRFLRNSSLDELPEIWNIFKGDMSIIGPRPLKIESNPYFTENEKSRFLVRGGLIPPEVLKNDPVPSWNDQLKWEAEYGINCSLKLDLKIFFTVFKLLLKRSACDYGDYERRPLSEERSK